jgi:hypothetical protein
LAVADDQADAVVVVAPAELGQLGVERLDALQDELHPPVGARQRIEQGAVEDEGAPHPARCLEGMEQRRWSSQRRSRRNQTRAVSSDFSIRRSIPKRPGLPLSPSCSRPARNKMTSWRRNRST